MNHCWLWTVTGLRSEGLKLESGPASAVIGLFSKSFCWLTLFSPSLYLLGEGKELKKIKRCPPHHTKKGMMKDSLNGVSALAHSSLTGVDEQGTSGQQGNGD